MKDRVKAGIIGILGYAGEELLRLLAGHARAEVAYAADKAGAGAGGRKIGDIYPALEGGRGCFTLHAAPCVLHKEHHDPL